MSINKLKDEFETLMSGGLGNMEQELSNNLGSVYFDASLEEFDRKTTTIGNIYQSDHSYTLVYGKYILQLIQSQVFAFAECSSQEDFTTKFKKYLCFAGCMEVSEDLDQISDWTILLGDLEKHQLAALIHRWSTKLNIPYLGYRKQGRNRRHRGGRIFAVRLPFTIGGKFVRLRSYGMGPKIIFDTPDVEHNDRACPVVLLHPAEIKKSLSE